VRPLAALLVAALTLALAAGCSDGSDEATTTAASTTASTQEQFQGDEAIGEALQQFVNAAAIADADVMWDLLTTRSKKELGPTEAKFTKEFVPDLQHGLGSFGGTPYDVVLSVKTDSGWGVAAVAGDRVRDGESEFAAYGAALREEDGGWRIELGDPIDILNNEPGETTSERQPRVQFEVSANAPVDEVGLWLDGAALPANAGGTADAVTVVATPEAQLSPGWHVLVVFGRAGDLASAGATPFQVTGGEDPTI
jgi:hypothetical protein